MIPAFNFRLYFWLSRNNFWLSRGDLWLILSRGSRGDLWFDCSGGGCSFNWSNWRYFSFGWL